MNRKEAVLFLFTIANELKRSFESPVILITWKDYAKTIFYSLVEMHTALLEHTAVHKISDIIKTFHIAWLQSVQDIEMVKKCLRDTPRDNYINAIDFTRECMKARYKYFHKFIDQVQLTMNDEEKTLVQTDLDIISDMCDIVDTTLLQKQSYLRNLADPAEFYFKISDEIDELLNWLDKLNDHLAIQFCKVLNLQVPELLSDLTKILQDIVGEVTNSIKPGSQKLANKIINKGKTLGSIGRIDIVNELEIRKVIEKIKILNDRIDRLQNKNSSALIALQHKTLYLKERLQSLENLKESFNSVRNQNKQQSSDYASFERNELQIFCHMLPNSERCRLVDQLVKLWDTAIAPGCEIKSIISILSAADIKEVFADDVGHFTVDKYSRKLYTLDNDSTLYQFNENHELVPMTDDEKHVYFYDECGRYFINDLRQRVYKAHETASEYLLKKAGALVKVKEELDGIVYYYDELGRYYVNTFGKRIYNDEDTENEYEHDDLGNLVKIRHERSMYDVCRRESVIMEEMKYLQQTIGFGLKKCLVEVVLHQPPDPVLYLAECLEKYRANVETHQRQVTEELKIRVEKIFQPHLTHNISPELSYGGAGRGIFF